MMSSLFAGVSGLRNHQVRMNLVGDNVANINTIGFKTGRVSFQEALVQTIRGASRPTDTIGGTNPLQLGLGMSISSIDNLFYQGGLETTGQITDLALQGSGFFVLSDGRQEFFTRAGTFGIDANSNLVNPGNGLFVQGKMADANGEIPPTATLGNIKLPFGQQDPARATTQIELGNNLNSAATDSVATLGSPGTTGIDAVSGTAKSGAGGIHQIVITGANATQSQAVGNNRGTVSDVTAPTGVAYSTGGSIVDGTTYYYYVTAVGASGETLGSESQAVTVNSSTDQGSVQLTWTPVTGARSYNIYRTTTSGSGYVKINSTQVTTNTYLDDGSTDSGTIPVANNATPYLTGAESLGTNLGVVDVSGFTIAVDGGTPITITGLTASSTVNDLISAINTQVNGVIATIENGQVKLTREYAGSGVSYNIQTSAAVTTSGSENIVAQVFGVADGTPFIVNNGTASTLVAVDNFTPTSHTVPLSPVVLELVADEVTGVITGIADLGDGGVTMTASGGLAAGTAIVNTADTEYATSITCYDSQGEKHTVIFNFTKNATPNKWYWEVLLGGNEVIRQGDSGVVTFNSDGSLSAFSFDDPDATTLRIDPNNGAEDMVINVLPGTPGEFDGLSSFASPFTATARNQDGYQMGVLNTISIDSNGLITGIFTNGVSRALAQIVLADFTNPAGLLKYGENLYQSSPNSGTPIKGIGGETINATMTSGALEMSNVDLAQEFTNMIMAQRGFQANARVITTSDDMLTELVNLKR